MRQWVMTGVIAVLALSCTTLAGLDKDYVRDLDGSVGEPEGPTTTGGASSTASASSGTSEGGGGGGGGTGGTGGAGGAGGCPDGDGDGQTSADCGGEDCADGDERAFKGQMEYFVTPVKGLPDDPVLKYDFNCDGGEEARYASSECKFETGGCDTSGHFLWITLVKCGESGEFGHCINNGFACPKEIEFVKKAQECR